MQDKKILVVEDEDILADPLVEKFQKKGYTVYRAKDGKEGLSLTKKHLPDAVLVDLIMPIMDGATMLQYVKAEPNTQHIKFFVLSNIDNVDMAGKLAGLGIEDYIVKADWKLGDIVDRVGEKLKK